MNLIRNLLINLTKNFFINLVKKFLIKNKLKPNIIIMSVLKK